jgi:hypothetical protein
MPQRLRHVRGRPRIGDDAVLGEPADAEQRVGLLIVKA